MNQRRSEAWPRQPDWPRQLLQRPTEIPSFVCGVTAPLDAHPHHLRLLFMLGRSPKRNRRRLRRRTAADASTTRGATSGPSGLRGSAGPRPRGRLGLRAPDARRGWILRHVPGQRIRGGAMKLPSFRKEQRTGASRGSWPY